MINMLLVFLRIYCDFSGYSDIARGSSLLLGFRLTENFRYPYISAGIADYWQRWHISLSSWMRDYVYKSFGAGKSGNFRRGMNLMATMFLCGLWHGAAWNFVIWGDTTRRVPCHRRRDRRTRAPP